MAEEAVVEPAVTFECRYCKAVLKTEKGFERHSCPRIVHVRAIGEENLFRVHRLFNFWFYFNKFSRKKDSKTLNEFIRTPYFGTFCDYYGFTVAVGVDQREYLKWLSINNIPAHKWHNTDIVERFMEHHQKNGDAHAQVIKTIEKIIKWGEDHGADYRDFFSSVSVSEALQWIDRGDLSPWVICLSENTPQLLGRFNESNLEYFNEMVDLKYWLARVEVSKTDADRIRETLTTMEL